MSKENQLICLEKYVHIFPNCIIKARQVTTEPDWGIFPLPKQTPQTIGHQ